MDVKDRLNKTMEKKRQVSTAGNLLIQAEIEKIKNTQIDNNAIAIVESFIKHGEVYPSIIKYFLDLGYNVHLYNLQEHQKVNSLVKCNFPKGKFKIFSFPKMPETKEFFDILSKHRLIFLCTLFTHEGYNFINNLNKNIGLENVFCISHELISIQKNIKTIECSLLNANRVFVLRNGIKYKDNTLPFLSPIFLGVYKINNKNEKITTFVSIGGGFSDNVHNFKLLFDSIDKLLSNNIKNFKVIFIGINKECLSECINTANKAHIDVIGYVSFKDMFDIIENSDWILFNIDNASSVYKKYINFGITGSYSLALAFSKPSIVFEELAKIYNFSKGCLCYNKNTLYESILKAITMDNQEYKLLQKSLIKIKDVLERESKRNLEKVIQGAKNG